MSTIDISYMGLGAQAGYRIVVDDVGLRILSFDWLHQRPTDGQLDSFSRKFVGLLEGLNAVPRKGESGLYESPPFRDRKIVIAPLEINSDGHSISQANPRGPKKVPPIFVKYLKAETYEQFTRLGSFKVGSLVDYRFIPDPDAQDPLEGYCNLYFRNRKNFMMVSAFGGENLHVYCGSNALGSDYMMQKFGPIQLILNDVMGFGKAMARHLGAIDWEIRPVTYGREKVWRLPSMHHSRLDPDKIETWIRCPETMHTLYRFLSEEGPPGTVFHKPVRYSPERELRFVFRMSKDITPPFWRSVDAPELLEFFRVVTP